MYGILGEDQSDVETLKVLIRKLAGDAKLQVKVVGCDGCQQMLREGKRYLELMRNLGCHRFVVSYDADGDDAGARRQTILTRIIRPAGVQHYCIVIPVQEIEAWILADIECVTRIFTGWKPDPITNPENIADPKEHLERLSRDSRRRPRYSHAIHNARVAREVDLEKLKQKCRSFQPLADFVEGQ